MDPATPSPSPSEPYQTQFQQTGTARPRWWLVVLTVAMVGAVWYMQRPEPEDPTEAQKAKVGLDVRAPDSDPLILIGKVVVAAESDQAFRDLMRAQVDGGGLTEDDPAGQVRTAMLLLGNAYENKPKPPPFAMFGAAKAPPAITERLEQVEKKADPESPLLEDVKALKPVAAAAASVDGESSTSLDERTKKIASALAQLTPEQVSGLKKRHGFFAEMLTTVDQPKSAFRDRAANQAGAFLLGATFVGLMAGVAFLTGVVLLIVGIVLAAQGKLRAKFERPPRLGNEQPLWAEHVWLETVCMFAGGFLAIKLVILAMEQFHASGTARMAAALTGNWLLTSAIFWPVVRGLNWKTWRERIGWRTNRPGAAGVFQEIGLGILGYMAMLPVLFGTVIVVFILGWIIKTLTGQEPISPKQVTKVQEMVSSGNVWITVCVFMLAVIWAPIVEESIFRGALFRHLRRGWPVIAAALVSALAFASMHPYALLQMIVVGMLGLCFALMREWRGSVIPSAVAHFIQNSFALTMMLAIGPLLRP